MRNIEKRIAFTESRDSKSFLFYSDINIFRRSVDEELLLGEASVNVPGWSSSGYFRSLISIRLVSEFRRGQTGDTSTNFLDVSPLSCLVALLIVESPSPPHPLSSHLRVLDPGDTP